MIVVPSFVDAILDVTTHAAEVLAFRNKGVARVRVETTKD